jgi:hypothetical protein
MDAMFSIILVIEQITYIPTRESESLLLPEDKTIVAHPAVGINAVSCIVCLPDPIQTRRVNYLRIVFVGAHVVLINAVARLLHIVRPWLPFDIIAWSEGG